MKTAVLIILMFLCAGEVNATLMCSSLFDKGSSLTLVRSKASPWVRFNKHFEKRSKDKRNPFIDATLNADKTGAVHQEFRKIIPLYDELIRLSLLPEVEYKDYQKILSELGPILLRIAKNKSATINQIFAALEATRIASIIEAKTKFPQTHTEKNDEKTQTEESKKDDDQAQEDNDDGEQEEDQFNWNAELDKYKPENKDMSGSGGKGKKAVEILKTTARPLKSLFRTAIYDVINLKEMTTNPLIRSSTSKKSSANDSHHISIIGTFGATEIKIPVQYGYEPVVGDFKGYRVVEKSIDDFYLEIQDKQIKEVSLLLKKKDSQAFSTGMGPSAYSMKTGIPLKDWPQEIQDFVNQNKGKPHLEIAKNLESFLSTDAGYYYFSQGEILKGSDLERLTKDLEQLKTQYSTPVAMARIKSFNCDGAAWIGASILRDFFNIPSRTAAGRTSAGSRVLPDGKSYSVIRSTDPKHMWVEVWSGSAWIPFDMTPKLNSPNLESAKSDLKTQKRKDVTKQNKKQESKKDKEGKSKDGKDGKSDSKSEGQKGKVNGEGTKVLEDVRAVESKTKHELRSYYLVLKVFEILKSWFGEMLLMDGNRNQTNSLVLGILNKLDIFQFSNYKKEAQTWFESKTSNIFDRKDESLSQWIGSVKLMASQGKLREAYLEIQAMETLIKSIGENRPLTAKEDEFYIEIQNVMREFRKIRHKNSGIYDLAERVYKNLPGPVSKQWVSDQYGSDALDLESISLQNFTADLQSGKLQALTRMSLLRRFVDVVLSSERIPHYKDEKTLFRSLAPKQSQDLVMARSPLEIQKMLLNPRPGEHIFSKLVRGEQFAIGSRDTVRIIDPKKPAEKKVSVLYYDLTGSMSGDKATLQDAFLMTYVDRAMADVDFAGNPMHEVYLFPFTETVHQSAGIHIKNVDDAKRFIAKMMNFSHQAEGSTDIQAALVHFYTLVANANHEDLKDKKSSLKKANLILITDGGSDVDMDTILAERKKVPQDIQINMNFLAISETNETLVELAKNSNMSTTKPMYRHIEHSVIKDIMIESQHPEINKDAFAATDIKPTVEIIQTLNKLSEKIADFKQEVNIQDVQKKMSEIRVAQLELKDITNTSAVAQLIQLQRILTTVDLPREIKSRIVYMLLNEYEGYSGRKLNRMLPQEKEAFDSLYEWARR